MARHIAETTLAAGLVLVLAGAACQSPISFGAPARPASVDADGDRRPDATDAYRDFRLFGQNSAGVEFEFEGKAFENLQQHTTASEGSDFDPAVDPGGKQLVFASTRHAAHSHIYVKAVDGATLTQLTNEPANDAQPVFCPQGRRIAFTSDRAGQWDIHVMDANGRNVRQITTSPAPDLRPSWSPDGRQLVFCRLNPGEPQGSLWVVDLDNPGMSRLIGEGMFPAWSPRGDKIAFQRARERGSRWFSIWTLDYSERSASYPTEVASSTLAAFIAPSWSADGTRIAFTAVLPGPDGASQPRINGRGRSDIFIVDADGRGMQRLTNGRGENYTPYWASDERVYFTARSRRNETIWSVRPFKPSGDEEPVVGPSNRRAASAAELNEE